MRNRQLLAPIGANFLKKHENRIFIGVIWRQLAPIWRQLAPFGAKKLRTTRSSILPWESTTLPLFFFFLLSGTGRVFSPSVCPAVRVELLLCLYWLCKEEEEAGEETNLGRKIEIVSAQRDEKKVFLEQLLISIQGYKVTDRVTDRVTK